MRALFVFMMLCSFFSRSVAQDICGELQYVDTSFTNAYKKVYNTDNPPAYDRNYFTNLYTNYKKFLTPSKTTDIVAVVGLTIITEYCFVLYREGKFKEARQEIQFGLENFLENLERGDARCYAAFKGYNVYSEEKVQHNIDNFFYVGTLIAFELNEPSFAQTLLMKVAERDLLGSFPEMNMAANKILKYKISRQEIDDTCFYAAYAAMLSDYEEKSVRQAMNDLNDAVENLHSPTGISTIKIITDAKRISYRPPMVKRYKYLNFYDYYIRLYKYLAIKKADLLFQHQVLKMFLQTFNADKDGGINVDFLNTLANGTSLSPDPIQAIIKEGDTELIQLLADFIWKHCTSKYDNRTLIYGGYLCYYHLGDKKMANKIYKKLDKSDTRFPKLD